MYSKKYEGFWADISVDSTSDGTYSWCLRISPHGAEAPGLQILDAASHPRRDAALSEALQALSLFDLAGSVEDLISAAPCGRQHRVIH
ncbi:MAG TPA: hypothetical protein VGM42_13245 [Rhodopila sp.]